MLRRLHGAFFWPVSIALVVAAACLLTRPVHEALVGLGWMDESTRDFLRVFRRLLLVPLVVVFLWRVRPWRAGLLAPYGLTRPRARWRPPLIAFGLTLVALVAILAWQFSMGWLRWEDPTRVGEFVRRLGLYVVGGLLAGLIEEWFFRGWLTARGTRDVGPRFGVLITAVLFGLSHAFRPSTLDRAVSLDAAGAFEALRGWAGHMVDISAFGPAALGLFLFSLLLAAAYRATGTLWTAVGVHAAAILVLFSYGALTERAPAPAWAGGRLLYDSVPVWILTALAALVLWRRGASDWAAPSADTAG